jgi:hypothetical protein
MNEKEEAVLNMDWNKTYRRIQRLAGKQLESITGKTDIVLESIDPEFYHLQWGEDMKKTMKRRTTELSKVVAKMALNRPVHVDRELNGSGPSRNQPETVLANLPDVMWVRIDGKKHIVWIGKDTHPLGTLKEKQ